MEKYRLLPSEECLKMTQLMALDMETSICSYRTCLLQTGKKSALFSEIKRKWTKKKSQTAEAWTLYALNKMKDLKVHCFLQRCLDFQGERYLPADFLGANMITLPIRPGCAGIILLLLWQSALLFQGVTVNRRFFPDRLHLGVSITLSLKAGLFSLWDVQFLACCTSTFPSFFPAEGKKQRYWKGF